MPSESPPLPADEPQSTAPDASGGDGRRRWQMGLFWALISPVFLGTMPIFAKLAYAANVNVLTVVAFRTLVAAGMLWSVVLLFRRELVRSSWPAVLSSLFAGAINGIGSLFFYSSLTRIDASLGQLINITYLLFVTVLLRLAGHAVSFLTLFRTGLAILGIYILTQGGLGEPDWIGVGMMAVAALMYAIQLVLSQRILYDTPAPTMTLYAITAMAGVVTIAWFTDPTDIRTVSTTGWQAILAMGIFTGLSRLTLFLGVKHLGSMQTALLGVLEVVVSILLAILFLGELFTPVQWLGALVLLISILLVRYERDVPRFIDWWKLFWRLRMRR